MHGPSELGGLLLILGVALGIVVLFRRVGLPEVAGFLLAGAVLGPQGLDFADKVGGVERLAEIGAILLLFVIGMEISLRRMIRSLRMLLLGGGLQVGITGAVTTGILLAVGVGFPLAVLLGWIVALSSTAVVLQELSGRGETDAPQGRFTVAVLLFQDLCVVPALLLVPVLAGEVPAEPIPIAGALLRSAAILAAVFVGARVLIPALLRRVVRLQSREIFILFVAVVCLGVAWLAASWGLSLAIGAFIAGLVISESEYSHQVTADILPFRDLFISLFFISIGMMLRLPVDAAGWLLVGAGVVAVVGLKGSIAGAVAWWVTGSLRLGVLCGLTLAQIGEFSFFLAQEGRRAGLLDAATFERVLLLVVPTLMLTPFLIRLGPPLAARWSRTAREVIPTGEPGRTEHVLVVGHGVNGRNLARVLKETGIPYEIIEMNADAVEEGLAGGEPIRYGDATRPEVLVGAGVRTARMVVVAISDPASVRRTVAMARQLNPTVEILARTRYLAEVEELTDLGADEVIPEEFETSVEIFTRVLRSYRIPANVIHLQTKMIRQDNYRMLRVPSLPRERLQDFDDVFAAALTDTFLVRKGSPAADRSLREIDLRRKTGATILAVVRDGKPTTNPAGDFQVRPRDVLVLVGSHAQLASTEKLLEGEGEGVPPDGPEAAGGEGEREKA